MLYFIGRQVISPVDTSKSYMLGTGVFSTQRLPTDPLFYSSITLQNIIVGSRYWVAQASDLTNVLASGQAVSSEVLIENIPAYANPMLVEIRVRKSSGGIEYLPLVTYGYLVRGGITVWIAQIRDSIVS